MKEVTYVDSYDLDISAQSLCSLLELWKLLDRGDETGSRRRDRGQRLKDKMQDG